MTGHPIYRVTSFQIMGPYSLCVQFDDQTEQGIDFEPVLAGELYRARCGIPPCFIKYEWIPKCIPWFGRTAPTLIRPRSTIGQNKRRRSCDAGASVGTDGCSSFLTAMRLRNVSA